MCSRGVVSHTILLLPEIFFHFHRTVVYPIVHRSRHAKTSLEVLLCEGGDEAPATPIQILRVDEVCVEIVAASQLAANVPVRRFYRQVPSVLPKEPFPSPDHLEEAECDHQQYAMNGAAAPNKGTVSSMVALRRSLYLSGI